MEIGRLDREITIESFTVTRNELMEEVKAWSTFYECWAEVRPVRAQERYEDGNLRAERQKVFRIRWREGIGSTMRIRYDDLIWNIRGVTEIGRREGLDILAEAEE